MLELVDRNMLSTQTLIERFGESFDIELQRMREEDNIREEIKETSEFALRKLGKFGPQIQDLMNEEENTPQSGGNPTGQEGQGQKGGSPVGKRSPRKKEKVPRKPQGQDSSARAFAAIEHKSNAELQFGILFKYFTNSMLKSRKLKDLESMNMSDTNRVYASIIRVVCMLDGKSRISRQQVAQVLKKEIVTEAGVKLDRCVRGVVKQKMTEFRKKNNKEPSSSKVKDMTSSAFAICRSQLGE